MIGPILRPILRDVQFWIPVSVLALGILLLVLMRA